MKGKKIHMLSKVLVLALVFAMATQTALACTTIIVGKDKTADGSVLLAHSEELGDSPQHLVVVPRVTHAAGDVYVSYSGAKVTQPAITYSYIASTIFDKNYYPGDFTTGINEYQVSVANNMSWTRGIPEKTAWDVVPGGLFWTEFTQLVLERCKTAREGVELMGQLCEKYHLSCDPGTMYGIADPTEGWFIEIARDGQWIAQRVPDNGSSMRANSYRIGAVDLNSPDILHSPEMVKYATDKGWYDPSKDGAFSFADVYGDPANQQDTYNTLRHDLVSKMLTADGQVTPKELTDILRSAYEGTEYYNTDPASGSPFHTDIRTISRTNTEVTCVAQLRSFLPKEIGGVMWWSLCTSKTSPYVPWYLGTQTFPTEYTKGTITDQTDSAYWVFDALRKYVDTNYSRTIAKVTDTWTPFETAEFNKQAELEAAALKIYNESGATAAAKYLNDYSNAQGETAYQTGQTLLASLKADAVKYFTDIADKNWAITAINSLYDKKVVVGVTDKQFAPDRTITRADFTVMLVKALGLTATVTDNFADVNKSAYYYDSVGIAKALGIASGNAKGYFEPTAPLTREDMTVLLSKALDSKKITLAKAGADLSTFTDSSSVAAYAKAPMALMVSNHIVYGSSETLAPQAASTRAQTAAILYRLVQNIGE